MRTGVSCQGKEVVAICFDDITDSLSHPAAEIIEHVKKSNMGLHNKSKDFVPASSEDAVIKRDTNSHSRKSTVIWLNSLPKNLQKELKQGNWLFLISLKL